MLVLKPNRYHKSVFEVVGVHFIPCWWRRCFVIGIQVKGKMTIEAKVIETTVMARKIIGVFLAILRDITSNILFCTVGLFFESIETD